MIRQAIARFGLAARIGAAIVAAVAAIQVLVTLVFVLNPPNFHPFYSARWLSDAAVTIVRNAKYDGPDHVTAFGKRTAIRRMVSNLIDNAVRYGEAARVSLREDAAEWIVTIADDGPGIPPESFEQAFEPFQRLESSRNRETGGTGLGLSIARDIALAHGGRISLANATSGGAGLIVTVLLPKAVDASWSVAQSPGGWPRAST